MNSYLLKILVRNKKLVNEIQKRNRRTIILFFCFDKNVIRIKQLQNKKLPLTFRIVACWYGPVTTHIKHCWLFASTGSGADDYIVNSLSPPQLKLQFKIVPS